MKKHIIFLVFMPLLILSAAILNSELKGKGLAKLEGKIYLVPVGPIEPDILSALESQLENIFKCKVDRQQPMPIPQETYSQKRGQYFSPLILEKISSSMKAGKEEKVLGIIDVDLYTEGLNFVFGEAERLGGRFAIISVARLHQSFYGLPEDRKLFLERAVKEAVHEIGHLYGLRHCPESGCVMHFSNSLPDTDRKSASFCSSCQELLVKIKDL